MFFNMSDHNFSFLSTKHPSDNKLRSFVPSLNAIMRCLPAFLVNAASTILLHTKPIVTCLPKLENTAYDL